MFSQTNCVVEIVGLSVDIDCIYIASKWLCKMIAVSLGLVAAKNDADETTFSTARFTKDDDVRDGLLGNPISFVIDGSEKTART